MAANSIGQYRHGIPNWRDGTRRGIAAGAEDSRLRDLCTARGGVWGRDAISPLAELVSDEPLSSHGLADQLLEFVAPRPRHPEALRQPRIVPLLGAAAVLLRHSRCSQQIVRLGATALEQGLRQHRALADRRATLIEK